MLTDFLPNAISHSIADMVERVGPSVVQVRRRGQGGGAGVIWTTDGRIITNHHVVSHGGPVEVLLTDGRTFEAQVTHRNPTLDLATLKVDATDLPAAPVGASTHLRIGELVFAIGHPWGQRGVVTAGIVSGLGEVGIPGGDDHRAQYIRADVGLAPGNSGGPLLDATGNVVGINAMIFGGDMAVAIPSHVATAWVAGQPSRRTFLGVAIQPVQLPKSRRGRAAGLRVVEVKPGGPAALAGLQPDDVLLDIDGQVLDHPDALLDAVDGRDGNGAVHLHVLRRGALLSLDLTPAVQDLAS